MAVTSAEQIRTYGNYRRPQTAGIFGLGTLGTTMLFIGAIIGVFFLMLGGNNGLWYAIGWVLLMVGVLVAMKTRDSHHVSTVERVNERIGWWRSEGSGANIYRSGPIGRAKWGTHQLPGLLAATTLTEEEDGYGRRFALLRMPAAGTYSIMFASEPAGASLVDPEVINAQVASYGAWLAKLADEPGLEAAAVTIETTPDSGERLREQIAQNIDPNAPLYARTMLQQAADSYPSAASMVRAYITLTFNGKNDSGKAITPAEMARSLASRMPNFTGSLQETGSGVAHSMTAQELCEIIRVAYDPASATLIEQAHAAGTVPDLTWSDVGPSAHEAGWANYRHDSGHSITWSMSNAPRGLVQSQVLERLLSPHRDILRKRVTLLYKPINSGKAAELVEKDKSNAEFRVSSAKKPTSRDLVSQAAARHTAVEEASGAGLVGFGMLVTATVASPAGEAEAVAAIDALAPTARVRLRRCFGSQDSAFAAGLPLGLMLPKYLYTPTALRELD